jgi:hypothetical protein
MHKVLSYREAAVYLQIAMHCDKGEVYHWGLDKIAACLGWKRTNALYACLNKLVDTGFLLKKTVPLPGVRKYHVNVYQRPSVGYCNVSRSFPSIFWKDFPAGFSDSVRLRTAMFLVG